MIIWVGLGEFLERQIGGKMAALAGPGWPALTLLHAACLPSLSLSSPAHQCNAFGPTFGAHGKLGGTLHCVPSLTLSWPTHWCITLGTCNIVRLFLLVQYTWRYIVYMLVHTGTVNTTRLEVYLVQLICCLLNISHSWCTLDRMSHVTCWRLVVHS